MQETALSARRFTLQLLHNTIVCAPGGLRDQLRSITRTQLICMLAAWRFELTAYREVEAVYRIGPKSVARRCLDLHDDMPVSK